MNIYAIVILFTLLIGYALDLLSGVLCLRSLHDEPPEELKDVFDPDRYRKSQEYTRVRTRFGFVTSTFALVLILVFWLAGGFNLLDEWIRRFHWPELLTGMVYIGALAVGQAVVRLPFSLYSTFVIEERFGFNKTTWKTYAADLVKGLSLSVVLGVPLLAAVLWFFDAAGTLAWLYAWATVTAFTLFVQYVAPVWIMPLFNKFTPLQDEELRTAILNYARSVHYPLKDILVMDGSKRSAKGNAFFTGWGRNKRIALLDTLLGKYSAGELVSVVAHEVGHYKLRHIIKGALLGILHTGVIFYLLSVFLTHAGLFDAFGMERTSTYAGLIFFGMLYAPIEMVLSIGLNALSRRHEYEADRFSLETTGSGEALAAALKKLSAHNLTNLTPHPLNVFLNYSHPPLRDRVRALRTTPAP